MKKILTIALCMMATTASWGKTYQVVSPNGKLLATIDDANGVKYAVAFDGQTLIKESPISMTIQNEKGQTLKIGTIKKAKAFSFNGKIKAINYIKNEVEDNYNQLIFQLKDGFSLTFRAYDEGIAYRFEATGQKKDFIVENEEATFTFAKDWKSYLPYANNNTDDIEKQVACSFESAYAEGKLSEADKNHVAFLPMMVEADNNVKIAISESDVENYPGLFVLGQGNETMKGKLANYPKEIKQGGHINAQLQVISREAYIAKAKAGQKFPWRIVNVTAEDKEILGNDMVYRLASPNRLTDASWIKPGKVAWDWWNDWGVYNVPFKAGINTETYKYYIDFASKFGIEYVILDEGWAVSGKADLFQIIPEIDLKEIIDYGKKKNVGIILWAGYYAFTRDMEKVCKTYSEMGVKGFKVDFMDRDDQILVNFVYEAAEIAAKYKLMLDLHGFYKPTGLNRTYPNLINFEGVKGQENVKWSSVESYNQVVYDVLLPFGRMLVGPLDYTQGAMLNGTKKTYHVSGTEPMSQGTRAHQLAEYAIFLSPLNMLCDSPTHYIENEACTEYIAKFPVVWDETIPLETKLGEYVAVARRSGKTWYVGVLNNWTERELTLDLTQLNISGQKVNAISDGPNAKKIAADHLHQTLTIPADGKMKVKLAPGGGFVMHN